MYKDENFKIKVLKSIFIVFLFFFNNYFQLIPILLFHIDFNHISDAVSIYLTTFSNIVTTLIIFLVYRKELLVEFRQFKKHFLENMDIGFHYWFFGLIGMALSNVVLTYFLSAGGATNEKIVQNMISTLPFLMLFNASIFAPIIEECTFRKAFKNVLKSKWGFVLFSGIVFGLLHVVSSFSSPIELLYAIPYSCLGISFAYMYFQSDTIFTSISMHMIHNFLLTLLSILT